MWRSVHSALGLIGLVLVIAMSLSGAVLAVYPLADRVEASQPDAGLSVADVAGKLAPQGLEIGSLVRTPSGLLLLNYYDADGLPQQGQVDAVTGQISPAASAKGPVYAWLKEFHRAFFLGDNGRILAGVSAGLMALLSFSGLALLISRMGGVRRVFDRPKGRLSARLHIVLSRFVLLPFLLSSLTGAYIVLTEFELVAVSPAASLAYPTSTEGPAPVSPGALHGLAEVPLSALRSLQYPFAGDTTDVFTLKTAAGLRIIDQFSGDVLETVPATLSETIYDWFCALHTGEGLAWIGALLGLAALMAPVIGLAGAVIWYRRRSEGRDRVPQNEPARRAEVVILVGSESGSTWGFARSLHRDLTATGLSCHLAAANAFSPQYDAARTVLFLTSTYGDWHAPDSAKAVLQRLALQVDRPGWSYAVLGFGDRAFPKYCQFAKDLDGALSDHGWPRLLPMTLINRQSTQAFATWGAELGTALGRALRLTHHIATPATQEMTLIAREDYGAEVQAQTAVLRFRLSAPRPGGMLQRLTGASGFSPADLLGILPPGEAVPRYYSIASAFSPEEVEICVRKQQGGVCSTFLHSLAPGDRIAAFTRPNPDFSLPSRRQPVIMVAAGTGLAPFVGLIRENRRRQPLHLIWGGRTMAADSLFAPVLDEAVADHSLATLTRVFSREGEGGYVQDRVRDQTDRLRQLLRQGAAVMVCGGDAMAQAVRAEFEAILAGIGQSVDSLKKRGAYLEDIF